MKSPKEIFRHLVEQAKDWRMFRGYGPSASGLSEYQREQNAKEIGQLVYRLPEGDRKVLRYLSVEDFVNERHEDPYFYPVAPKRKRSRTIRLVVNNDKPDSTR
jgi:uncharacterized protein (DUF3084 family)